MYSEKILEYIILYLKNLQFRNNICMYPKKTPRATIWKKLLSRTQILETHIAIRSAYVLYSQTHIIDHVPNSTTIQVVTYNFLYYKVILYEDNKIRPVARNYTVVLTRRIQLRVIVF